MASRSQVYIILALGNCLLISNELRLAAAQRNFTLTPPTEHTTDYATLTSPPGISETADHTSPNLTSPQHTSDAADHASLTPTPTSTQDSTSDHSSALTSAQTTTPPPSTGDPSEPSFTGDTDFKFSILFNAIWNDTLNDSQSDDYQQLANDTATSLNDVYSSKASALGYSAIIVDRFTDSSNYSATSYGTRSNMNMFGDTSVIAYYRAVFTTDAAYRQTDAIQKALTEIQTDLVNATIGPAGYNTSDDYLNDTMATEITANIAEVNKSKSNYCNSSTDVCQPYETCQYDVKYNTDSGIACVPGCYQHCRSYQECTYEDYTSPVCSVSVVLFVGLAIGVIIIAILVVILVMQSRKMKRVKSMPATNK